MKKIRAARFFAGFAVLSALAGVCLGAVGIVWTRVFDSLPGDDTVTGIAGLPGGGGVVLGATFASGIRAIGYDPNGTAVGSAFLPNRDLPVGPGVASPGAVYIGGRDLTSGLPFVARYDASGGKVWDNTFDPGGSFTPMCLAVDNVGNVVIAGNLEDGVNPKRVFVLKVDGTGKKIWDNTYAAPDSQAGTTALTEIFTNHSLAVAPSGDVFVGCYYSDSALDDELIVLKFDRDTGIVTTGGFGGPGDQKAYAVAVAPDGEIFAAGRTRNGTPYDLLLVRFRPDLTVRGAATKSLGGKEARYVTTPGPDNVFVYSNNTIVRYQAGDADPTDPVERWSFPDPLGGTFGDILPADDGSLLALVNRGGATLSILRIQPDGLAYDNVASYSAAGVTGRDLAASGTYLLVAGDQSNGTDRDMVTLSVGEPFPPPASSGGGGACFVATAAWGSPLAQEVATLRQFRDRFLLTSAPGRFLVETYYRASPELASRIGENDLLRAASRFLLVTVVLAASIFVNTGVGGIILSGIVLVFIGLLSLPKAPRKDRQGTCNR